jgi:flagellar secretion chaperone FliS
MYKRVNPWQSYRQVATQTASPGQLVLMLFDGAARFLDQALEGFSETDPLLFNQTISNNIIKAQAIINELNLSLNMEVGGEFSARMRALYDYLDRRLQESNLSKTETGIREVLKHITSLRDAWSEMLQNGPYQESVAGASAQAPMTFAPKSADQAVAA